MFGIQTRGHGMEGADESSDLFSTMMLLNNLTYLHLDGSQQKEINALLVMHLHICYEVFILLKRIGR